MLKRWKIRNFKSLEGDVGLEIRPLTVICGANSSGKSSILQSMLLMKQTISSDQRGKQMALNGHWVKLGLLRDVISHAAHPRDVGIEFEFCKDESKPLSTFGGQIQTIGWTTTGTRNHQIANISVDLTWKEDESKSKADLDKLSGLYPLLSRLDMRIDVKDGFTGADRTSNITLSPPSNFSPVERVDHAIFDVVDIDESTRRELFSEKPKATITGCFLSGVLPDDFAVYYDQVAALAEQIANFFASQDILLPFYPSPEVPVEVISAIRAWLVERKIKPFAQNTTDPEAVRHHLSRVLRPHTAHGRAPQESMLLESLRIFVREKVLEVTPAKSVHEFRQPQAIRAASAYLRDFFLAGMRYLGPLRDEPKPVYPQEALVRPDDVGIRGEHTAAVLDLNRNREVFYITPPGQNGEPGQKQRAKLLTAVVEWLSYLGVASNVDIQEESVFGYRLRVQSEPDGQLHDLTQVGVGVSQVLPIVVMCMLARPSALLIFEQPELHLHPRVQQRLADFFLATAQVGKQCVIETHSEYLIDRIRRRVAEAESNSVLNLVGMYFTEKTAGRTSCRSISLTEYGALNEWPRDFFDQTQAETERILIAASEKRRRARRQAD